MQIRWKVLSVCHSKAQEEHAHRLENGKYKRTWKCDLLIFNQRKVSVSVFLFSKKKTPFPLKPIKKNSCLFFFQFLFPLIPLQCVYVRLSFYFRNFCNIWCRCLTRNSVMFSIVQAFNGTFGLIGNYYIMTILMMLSSNKNGYYVFPLIYVSVSANAESKRLHTTHFTIRIKAITFLCISRQPNQNKWMEKHADRHKLVGTEKRRKQ